MIPSLANSPDALERLFSLCGRLVLPGWLLLIAAPRWRWSQRIATFVLPLLLASLYIWLLATAPRVPGAGFNSLHAVSLLFTQPAALLAGWIHYLAFDLFIGSWETRDARALRITHWAVVPCLLLTFLFGPVGLALYLLLRLALRRQAGVTAEAQA